MEGWVEKGEKSSRTDKGENRYDLNTNTLITLSNQSQRVGGGHRLVDKCRETHE